MNGHIPIQDTSRTTRATYYVKSRLPRNPPPMYGVSALGMVAAFDVAITYKNLPIRLSHSFHTVLFSLCASLVRAGASFMLHITLPKSLYFDERPMLDRW